MESILRALRDPLLSTAPLGYGEDGREVGIDPDHLKTHVQFVGVSGKGKSRTVEHVIRELISQGAAGLLFIDPHGEVYEPLVEWCALQEPEFLEHRKVHLFDPADPQWRMAFNPLHVPEGGEIADSVDLVLNSIAQVMDGEDLERMPLYQRTFGAIIYALAARRLTLLETMLALPATQDTFRLWLADHVTDRVMEAVWEEIHGWNPREPQQFDERRRAIEQSNLSEADKKVQLEILKHLKENLVRKLRQ